MLFPTANGEFVSRRSGGHVELIVFSSVQTAMQISFGGIGGIVGTVAYRAKDAPRYIPGRYLKQLLVDFTKKKLLSHITLRRACYDSWFSSSSADSSLGHNNTFHEAEQTNERRKNRKAPRRSTGLLLYYMMFSPKGVFRELFRLS